jgi:protein-S-isoprenylcysteine O-methyltransferase Ste14
MTWWMIDLLIIFAYGLQHTLLTTKLAVNIYNKILPDYSWNLIYSILSVITIFVGFRYWQTSGVNIFYLTPGSLAYHLSVVILACSLFFFFYCFKFTTSFWQWLGVKQVAFKIMNKPMPAYYRTRQNGIKRYIRFPHHTCLIFFFWAHPVMSLDTLLLAIGATVYLYVGTYHQDLRGLRIIGREWEEYRKNTSLLFPRPLVIRRMVEDFRLSLGMDAKPLESAPEATQYLK